VARTRTTKKLAQRIDLNYFKRSTPLKRAKLLLSVGLPMLVAVWIVWLAVARDSHVYSSGRLSEAHAVLERQCTACHLQVASGFSAKASDGACLSCHDGPTHHGSRQATLGCAECHSEHRGNINIKMAKSQSCAQCHSDLQTSLAPRLVTRITNFDSGHPEFAALRENARDPGTIRVNHALHMKPIRSSPNGPNVQLECGDCHRTSADAMASSATAGGRGVSAWKYADAKYVAAAPSYSASDEILPLPTDVPATYRPASGREWMAPVTFATACAGCHSLAFDKRFADDAPHDKPEVVRAFLVKKFSEYIAAHPGDLREVREPQRDLTGKPAQAEVRIYTQNEWTAAKVADAEALLWRKTCKQCHALTLGSGASSLPSIAPARTTVRWMPRANFDHDAHRGFSCVSCHEKALSSTETSDVLLPGIATCRTCHAPGPEHANSRCAECHAYHDWSKRKEVTPTFTLPALRSGGG
jgi:transcription elongation factor Elf1